MATVRGMFQSVFRLIGVVSAYFLDTEIKSLFFHFCKWILAPIGVMVIIALVWLSIMQGNERSYCFKHGISKENCDRFIKDGY